MAVMLLVALTVSSIFFVEGVFRFVWCGGGGGVMWRLCFLLAGKTIGYSSHSVVPGHAECLAMWFEDCCEVKPRMPRAVVEHRGAA